MLALSIASLLTIVALASVLTLVDCWIRGRYEFVRLRQEAALLDAGFVPMADPASLRARQPLRFEALATPARVPAARPVADRPRVQPRVLVPGAA